MSESPSMGFVSSSWLPPTLHFPAFSPPRTGQPFICFYLMVFMYIFPFPQFLPDPSHPTSFSLSFSSSLPQNRQTNKTPIRQKNNKAKQKRVCVHTHMHERTNGVWLDWPTTPENEACPGMWWIYPETLHWSNWFSLSQQASIANSFLVRRRILCPPLLLSTRILSGSNLCRPCVCCHSLREFLCIAALLGIDDVIFLESTSISGSCNFSASSPTQTLNLEESHLIKTSNVRLSTSKSLAFCVFSSCGSLG